MKPAMLFCALVLVLPAQAFAGPKGDPKAEGKSKGKIAETALAGAEELLGMGAHIEAQKALAEAEAAGGDRARIDAAKAKVDATLAASEPGKARWAKLTAELAKAYERLAGQAHEPADAARFEGYLFKAAELEPSKARLSKLFASVKQASGNKGQTEVAGRMLVRLRDLDTQGAAEGRYEPLEHELASGDVAIRRGPLLLRQGGLGLLRRGAGDPLRIRPLG